MRPSCDGQSGVVVNVRGGLWRKTGSSEKMRFPSIASVPHWKTNSTSFDRCTHARTHTKRGSNSVCSESVSPALSLCLEHVQSLKSVLVDTGSILDFVANLEKNMRTRSGVRIRSKEQGLFTLWRSDIRHNADDTPHCCPICLDEMTFSPISGYPSWKQCPHCLEVVHECCLHKYISCVDSCTIACPTCREVYAKNSFEENVELWSIDSFIDSLFREDNDCDYHHRQENGTEIDPPQRVLRSQAKCT